MAAGVDQVLSLVARHPLLTRRQFAVLVCTTPPRIGRLLAELLERAWIRPILHAQLSRATHAWTVDQIQRLGLVELTPTGRREAARRLLLPGPVAARHQGLVGGRVAIRRFLRHLAHTVGANAFFVALVQAARNVCRRRGGEDALEDWRSAAACARGRFRPDDYGCYRRAGSRFGFSSFGIRPFGPNRPCALRRSTPRPYRYHDSGTAARDYDGFPTLLLLVTISDVAEARFAHQVYLALQQHGSTPLCVLLTTTQRIEAHAEGCWDRSGAHARGKAGQISVKVNVGTICGTASRFSSAHAPGATTASRAAWPMGHRSASTVVTTGTDRARSRAAALRSSLASRRRPSCSGQWPPRGSRCTGWQ